MLPRQDNASLFALIAVLLAATFIVDLQTRLGVAVWVFYIAPLAVSLFSARPATPIAVGLASACLTISGFFLSEPTAIAEVDRMAPVNRGFMVVVFLVFAFMGRQFVANRLRLLQEDALKSAQTGLSARMQGE